MSPDYQLGLPTRNELAVLAERYGLSDLQFGSLFLR